MDPTKMRQKEAVVEFTADPRARGTRGWRGALTEQDRGRGEEQAEREGKGPRGI